MNIIKSLLLKIPRKRGLYKYKNYKEYKDIQIRGNLEKIDSTWVSKENIKFLSGYIKKNVPKAKFGICHGTRRGDEQKWFREYLGIEVIGTEISPTAKNFPHTIEWDFHKVKDEWTSNVDFIYSNSFDHSYKPKECLDSWMSCLKKDGICILEWTNYHKYYSKLDPYGGTLKDYKELIAKKYKIIDILQGKKTGRRNKMGSLFFIIGHRK